MGAKGLKLRRHLAQDLVHLGHQEVVELAWTTSIPPQGGGKLNVIKVTKSGALHKGTVRVRAIAFLGPSHAPFQILFLAREGSNRTLLRIHDMASDEHTTGKWGRSCWAARMHDYPGGTTEHVQCWDTERAAVDRQSKGEPPSGSVHAELRKQSDTESLLSASTGVCTGQDYAAAPHAGFGHRASHRHVY